MSGHAMPSMSRHDRALHLALRHDLGVAEIADNETARGRSWGVGSAVIFTVGALVPGVGFFFGIFAVCAALWVLIVPRYTQRQKWTAAGCLVAAAMLTALQVLLLMLVAI